MSLTVRIFYHMEQVGNKNSVLRNVVDLDRENIWFAGIRDVRWNDGTVSPGCAHCGCFYLIEGGDKRVLVDTGGGDLDKAVDIYKRMGAKTAITESPDGSVVEQLAKAGCKPEDIDIVINTHLHWDHIGGNDCFPGSHFYMPADDLPMALSCPRSASFFWKEWRHCILNHLDHVTFTSGKTPVIPGVETWQVGGHTPGSSFVMVKTAQGVVAIAGDVIPKYVHLENFWPGFADLYDYAETMDAMKLARRKADIVLPGHDWTVAERYPDGIIG